MQILIVEDESKLAYALQQGLEEEGYSAAVALSGEDALRWLERSTPDLVLLDVMLSKRNGLSVLREFRKDGFHTPVLLLTARDAVEDRVLGLDAGADDYLVKPFAMSELVARTKALLRRPGAALGTTLKAGNIVFDTIGRDVSVAGIPLQLPRREAAILEHLLRRQGRVVPK